MAENARSSRPNQSSHHDHEGIESPKCQRESVAESRTRGVAISVLFFGVDLDPATNPFEVALITRTEGPF